MFNFDFTFLSDPFSITDIVVGLLTVGGTALATYLAAKYAGKNANDIAEKNNRFQEKQLYNSKKEESLIQFLVIFNSLSFTIEDFYGLHKDDMRITAFNPVYEEKYKNWSPKYRDYINLDEIKVQNLNDLGQEIIIQTDEIEHIVIELDNNLLKIKRYLSEDDYNEVRDSIKTIIYYYKYIRTNAYSFSKAKNLNNHLYSVDLIFLHSDINLINSERATQPNFTTSADPFLHAYFKLQEYKNPIINKIESYIED